jgi:hypothetical protein
MEDCALTGPSQDVTRLRLINTSGIGSYDAARIVQVAVECLR